MGIITDISSIFWPWIGLIPRISTKRKSLNAVAMATKRAIEDASPPSADAAKRSRRSKWEASDRSAESAAPPSASPRGTEPAWCRAFPTPSTLTLFAAALSDIVKKLSGVVKQKMTPEQVQAVATRASAASIQTPLVGPVCTRIRGQEIS